MTPSVTIGDRRIGPSDPTFVIAELSGNHGGQLERAKELVALAARAGADAVKIQTYTADTLTIKSHRPEFTIGDGTPWEGRTLHDLYGEAATPWEWHDELAAVARASGIEFFSTPFDRTAVEFLAERDVPAFKIASFEIVDVELVALAAAQGRPLLISTGMATVAEIDRAIAAAWKAGAEGIVVLRCNSAYPAPAAEMDLATIPEMARRWPDVVIGFSDHTLGTTAAVVAVALGARVVEKHFTMDRSEGGPDASFSLEPAEFADLVAAIREAESSIGSVRYGPTGREQHSLVFRRSLFVVEDVRAGDVVSRSNVRSIRPGYGLDPGLLTDVLGCRFAEDVERGTPLSQELLAR